MDDKEGETTQSPAKSENIGGTMYKIGSLEGPDPRDPEGDTFAKGARTPQQVSERNANRTTPDSSVSPIIDEVTGKPFMRGSKPVYGLKVSQGFRGKR